MRKYIITTNHGRYTVKFIARSMNRLEVREVVRERLESLGLPFNAKYRIKELKDQKHFQNDRVYQTNRAINFNI